MKILLPLEFLERLNFEEKRNYVYDLKVACCVVTFGKKGQELQVPLSLLTNIKKDKFARYFLSRRMRNRFADFFTVLKQDKSFYGFGKLRVLCLKDLSDLKESEIREISIRRFKRVKTARQLLIACSYNRNDLRNLAKRFTFSLPLPLPPSCRKLLYRNTYQNKAKAYPLVSSPCIQTEFS